MNASDDPQMALALPLGDDGGEVNDVKPNRRVVASVMVKPNTLSVSDALDHSAAMPPDSVDLVVFSPPYDEVRDYNGDWKIDLPALGAQLLRVVRDGGFAVVVIADGTKNQRKSMTTFRTAVAWEDAGWSLFESVIYSRDGRPGASSDPLTHGTSRATVTTCTTTTSHHHRASEPP